jgi:hypothetical protein
MMRLSSQSAQFIRGHVEELQELGTESGYTNI